jgi:hypothetical protein
MFIPHPSLPVHLTSGLRCCLWHTALPRQWHVTRWYKPMERKLILMQKCDAWPVDAQFSWLGQFHGSKHGAKRVNLSVNVMPLLVVDGNWLNIVGKTWSPQCEASPGESDSVSALLCINHLQRGKPRPFGPEEMGLCENCWQKCDAQPKSKNYPPYKTCTLQ